MKYMANAKNAIINNKKQELNNRAKAKKSTVKQTDNY